MRGWLIVLLAFAVYLTMLADANHRFLPLGLNVLYTA